MKSPNDIAGELVRQWNNPNTREQRLLDPESWPVIMAIGKPSSTAINHQPDKVRDHLSLWQKVKTGKVHWADVKYRGAATAINIPTHWELAKPSEWIEASRNNDVQQAYDRLISIVSQVEPVFHSYLIRQRRWFDKPVATVLKAAQLAAMLQPGFAEGAPLRTLAIANIDTKFFEHNTLLIKQLLDLRFDGLASEMGLEAFLGAPDENSHWLLLADLDSGLLPFKQMRIRDSELATTGIPTQNILIVENETCLHRLPALANTIAILGAGLNLSWMKADWLASKNIAYWGDMDTWGMTMLARARKYQPELTRLLMDERVFNQYQKGRAVTEPSPSVHENCSMLTVDELDFMNLLANSERGRLEQEFLPEDVVHNAVQMWHAASTN